MVTLTRTLLASLALAISLTACGGGGGSSSENRAPTTDMPTIPSPQPTAYTSIGTDVFPVETPTPQGSYEGTAISFDRTPGGHDAQAIVEYLRAASGGGGPAQHPETGLLPYLLTYPTPPTVHIAAGTPQQFREITAQAIAHINQWLPSSKRIHIAADAPALAHIDDVPQAQIFIDFTDPANWLSDLKTGNGVAESKSRTFPGGPHKHASRIWINPQNEASILTTTTHEFLHALLVSGHISRDRFPDTIMSAISNTGDTIPTIDGEALLAAYTRFDPGTPPEEISAATLGPWATETMHIQGDLAAAGNRIAFGVSYRNGLAHPWARGVRPDTDLADNTALHGSAEWNGTLLGFTSSGNTAAGSARIGVELTTMAGTADFTDIETWSGAPGAKGTGAAWGSLAYQISVNGNSFRNTGGDTGDLQGAFVGLQHQGATGTLEREDLTASFGATRSP